MGQEAVESMEGLAEEMSLKSPQLFTGYTTVTTRYVNRLHVHSDLDRTEVKVVIDCTVRNHQPRL